jgi:DNA-binding response OmpR family regulator
MVRPETPLYWGRRMYRIGLLYQTEGASLLERDLAAHGLEVQSVAVSEAAEALADAAFDAFVLEAAASIDETRRLLEQPARQPKTPLVLLLRPEQLSSIEPGLPIDDFVLTPVAGEELALRLRRLIWRRTGVDSANVIRSGDLVVDVENYKVFVEDVPVTLTYKEFELLRFLMTNRGKVFSREALLNRVWGYEYFGGARTVDVHIRRLRSKIETGATVYIETVRNVGYRFPGQTT